ncbi:MAG: lytic transglycosylase domain-containing protein [bacterium]|nr:lytic transglycosylase domain-containing protein [bacterium]
MYTNNVAGVMHRSTILFLIVATIAIAVTCGNDSPGSSSANNGDTLSISQWRLPTELSFCGEKVPMNDPEVRERLEREFYVNVQSPGQIILYIKRSARYFPMYERLLREKKMPDDLKYVSVAESALYMSKSPKDAVGLWQFIPATAKAMGLIVNEQVDERRQPEKSTVAALKYLRDGYDSNGSWTNAAAGYNMGHTNFSSHREFQSTKEFYNLYLNEETSRYILRIIMVKYLMENAAQFGIIVPAEERYQASTTREVSEKNAVADLSVWARANGTTYRQVKLLNPWILGRGLPSPERGRQWEITLPAK